MQIEHGATGLLYIYTKYLLLNNTQCSPTKTSCDANGVASESPGLACLQTFCTDPKYMRQNPKSVNCKSTVIRF